MKLGLAEILNKASELKTRKERADYLRKHDNRALQDIIQYALHPAITWDLPPGAPPYKPSDHLDTESLLYREVRRLYLFCNGRGNHLHPTRREALFVQLLESVSPKDAELLLLVKERKLPKGLTPSVIEEVWPGLIPNDQDEKVSQE